MLSGAAHRLIFALRGSRWGLLVTVGAFALFLGLCVERNKEPSSDGFYTWLFARSLVYDHDIDFTNDYAICGDPQHKSVLRGTQHPDNPFYVGPSVVWVPVLAVVRALSHVPANDVACRGPLAVGTLRVAPVLGALIVWFLYRIGRRFAGDGVAGMSAGLLGMGTPLLRFASVSTTYSHVYDAFWATAAILAGIWASERPTLARWGLAGALVGVDLLQRPVSVFYVVVPAALAIASAPPPRWRRAAGALAMIGVGVALFGVLPQALVYKYLYGHYWVGAPAGRYFMQYGHSHPWLLLFGPRGGLFFTNPIIWLAVPGFVLGIRDPRARVLTASMILAAAVTTWLSAAALDWVAGYTFGARRLTSIVGLLAPAMTMVLAAMARWLKARPLRPTYVLAMSVCIVVAIGTSAEADVPNAERGRSQEELYGGAASLMWRTVDHWGDLAILPAEVVFHLRYGLPMRAFRAATEPCCGRDVRTMSKPAVELKLAGFQEQLTGFAKAGDGVVMTGRRATFVFTPEWPYETDLAIRAKATLGAGLRVGRGTAGGTIWYGERSFGPEVSAQPYSIPPDGFDSGLFELVFERTDEGGGDVTIQSIRLEDNGTYGPPF